MTKNCIEVRVKDKESNVHHANFNFEFKNELDCLRALHVITPMLLERGCFTAKQLDFEFNLSGVQVQQGDESVSKQ